MALEKERLKGLFRDMFLIRNFEDVIKEYAANGNDSRLCAPLTGQEACQAGVCARA
jgi:TPP-dependent pyruvate/acetoin dehydrogenase alpha subunit